MLETLAQQGGGLLDSIADFCRRTGMAESTLGRRAVNDGLWFLDESHVVSRKRG